jgi:hypothetical protein
MGNGGAEAVRCRMRFVVVRKALRQTGVEKRGQKSQ